MKLDPRDGVAVILAICVLWFYASETIAGFVLRYVYPGQEIFNDQGSAELWADLTKTIIGGLLVFIAARKRGGPNDDDKT